MPNGWERNFRPIKSSEKKYPVLNPKHDFFPLLAIYQESGEFLIRPADLIHFGTDQCWLCQRVSWSTQSLLFLQCILWLLELVLRRRKKFHLVEAYGFPKLWAFHVGYHIGNLCTPVYRVLWDHTVLLKYIDQVFHPKVHWCCCIMAMLGGVTWRYAPNVPSNQPGIILDKGQIQIWAKYMNKSGCQRKSTKYKYIYYLAWKNPTNTNIIWFEKMTQIRIWIQVFSLNYLNTDFFAHLCPS